MCFQLIVTLFLLYTQVGVAFVAGVIFSLILIPINKVITMKIGTFYFLPKTSNMISKCPYNILPFLRAGDLSTRMMAEKDKRVEMTSELLKGIRVIKLHVWEEYFVNKILGWCILFRNYFKCKKNI